MFIPCSQQAAPPMYFGKFSCNQSLSKQRYDEIRNSPVFLWTGVLIIRKKTNNNNNNNWCWPECEIMPVVFVSMLRTPWTVWRDYWPERQMVQCSSINQPHLQQCRSYALHLHQHTTVPSGCGWGSQKEWGSLFQTQGAACWKEWLVILRDGRFLSSLIHSCISWWQLFHVNLG